MRDPGTADPGTAERDRSGGACIKTATGGNPVLVRELHHSTETEAVLADAGAEQTLIRRCSRVPDQARATAVVLDVYRTRGTPL